VGIVKIYFMAVENPEQPLWVFRLTSGLMARLIPLSLILLVAAIAIYVPLASHALATAPFNGPALAFTIVLVLVVHEALHGVAFAVFGGRPKFGAGIKSAMPYFYATCPGKRFTWGQTLVIGALPFVVIDIAALGLAGYSPLVVPALVAFATNTTGAVVDLWLIAVILQTPRTALFEDTDDGPAMIAWPGPGTQIPARPPRGLDPRGYESVVNWSVVAIVLFPALLFAISFVEVALARASANGRLMVGSFELASVTTTNGRFSARFSFLPDVVLAVVLTAVLIWAARKFIESLRARNARRRPPEDDA
jgi:hypothetical protein